MNVFDGAEKIFFSLLLLKEQKKNLKLTYWNRNVAASKHL
jgi:hypothetical protein